MVIIGCGYVGTRLALQGAARGESVRALVASDASQARLRALGIETLRRDLDRDALPRGLLDGAAVFHLAPPPAEGTIDTRTRRLIESFAVAGQPRRLVYISTTGVYGDCQGAWIDEDHPIQPVAERSQRRWDAEQALRQWSRDHGRELAILRVAGIYGPERLPLERLRAGTPMVRQEDAPFTNRIHVDDLVGICLAAMARAPSGAVYNVSDGHPSTMTEYFLAVAAAAGLEPPPLIGLAEANARLSSGMRSYLAESRRLSNRRLGEELGVRLSYPTLADGLAAIFGGSAAPASSGAPSPSS